MAARCLYCAAEIAAERRKLRGRRGNYCSDDHHERDTLRRGTQKRGGVTPDEAFLNERPRLLDLFCGAGGAAVGYARAGFEVVGVDHVAQPNYPFEFWQRDALDVLREGALIREDENSCGGWVYGGWALYDFDAIHASPPCQHYANVTAWRGRPDEHADLVPGTRRLLEATGLPYVIENVREAGLHDPLLLCGSMFGLAVRRHRHFEANWPLGQMAPFGCSHRGLLPFMHKGERAYADAMGCEWMTNREARQAIPPAFTEFVGAGLLQHVQQKAAA